MKLQTEIKLKKQDDNLIDYHSNLLLLGSCFSENIGEKLDYFKFQSISNPFGILFHPKAIETLVVNAIQKKEYSENDIFFHNEQWHCYDAHSKLSNASKEKLIQELNQQIKLTNNQISESTHVIITLGTAWAYDLIESDKTVANCHKVPQKQFNKKVLTVDDIVKSLQNTVKLILQINKETAILFTVSPVRHIKDGFVENTQSKSHLITAIHQVLNTRIHYFPSFELMLDELRDYRFYKSDMLHPNEIAIEYIWQKFQEVWIASGAEETMNEVEAIQKGLAHKPFNPITKAHEKFVGQIKEKQLILKKRYPHISF